MIYQCEVHDGRRVIAVENRNIVDIRNGAEVQAVLASIARGKGSSPSGCTMRVFEPGRRPRLVQEVTA